MRDATPFVSALTAQGLPHDEAHRLADMIVGSEGSRVPSYPFTMAGMLGYGTATLVADVDAGGRLVLMSLTPLRVQP